MSPKAITIPEFSYIDAKKYIKNFTIERWQQYWSNQTTKLNEIKISILPWLPPPGYSRRQETIINHLRIGHTSLTLRHLMTREDPPNCTTCTTHDQAYLHRVHKIINKIVWKPSEPLEIFSPESTTIQKLFIFLKKSTLYQV